MKHPQNTNGVHRQAILAPAAEPPPPSAAPADTDDLPPLSDADQRHLAAYEKKIQLVRDRVVGVVRGLHTGLYIWGSGGIGKSYSVLSTLRELQADYRLFNSRMDGRALYNHLAQYPESIHCGEDVEQILRIRSIAGLLRSALWGQSFDGGPMDRHIKWGTCARKKTLSCSFGGAVILVVNCPPPETAEWQAIETRIPIINLAASDSEIRAMMRAMARQGYTHAESGCVLTPAECTDVCDYVIARCQGVDRSMDLRLLVTAWQDYILWDSGYSGTSWQDLVASRINQRPVASRQSVDVSPSVAQGIAGRQQVDREIARQIHAQTDDPRERERLWRERTGKSRSTLFSHLRALGLTGRA